MPYRLAIVCHRTQPNPVLCEDIETGRVVVELSRSRVLLLVALLAVATVSLAEFVWVKLLPWLDKRWASVGYWPWREKRR